MRLLFISWISTKTFKEYKDPVILGSLYSFFWKILKGRGEICSGEKLKYIEHI